MMHLNGTSDAASTLLALRGGGNEEEVGRSFGETSLNDFFFGVFIREATLKVEGPPAHTQRTFF